MREAKVERQRIAIDDRLEVGMRFERLQLRCEQNGFSGAAPVERLHSHAVADEMQLLPLAIPQRNREHPDESPNRRRNAPRFERRQHHLGVGVAAEMRR